MSNSEPSVIARQGIPCMGGLYIDWNRENGSLVDTLPGAPLANKVSFDIPI
jgi:hypothetical protein